MSAAVDLAFGLPVGEEGEVLIPDQMAELVPDDLLIEMEETPVAIAYTLKEEPEGDVWEHRFECPNVRMFASDGCVVILGDFTASGLIGFDDACDPEEDKEE